MVALVDELEEASLLERRLSPLDRRANALFLTPKGRRLLARLMKVSATHEAELCAGLSETQRELPIELLGQIAANQGLATGVHPAVADDPSRDDSS